MVLDAGFAPYKTDSSGLAKYSELFDLVVHRGCPVLNLAGVKEIDVVAACAGALCTQLPVRARVCPDISSCAAPGLVPGVVNSPFGIGLQDFPARWDAKRRQERTLICQGVNAHAGCKRMLSIVYPNLIQTMRYVLNSGQAAALEQPLEVNLGGRFRSDPAVSSRVQGAAEQFMAVAQPACGTDVLFESEQHLVKHSVSLFCRFATIEDQARMRWVMLDACYCHLSDGAIVNARFPLRAFCAAGLSSVARVADPLCDSVDTYRAPSQTDVSADFFTLPDPLDNGDGVIEIILTGAYVYCMGNHCAGFGQPEVVLFGCDGNSKLIRHLEQYQDMRDADSDLMTVHGNRSVFNSLQ